MRRISAVAVMLVLLSAAASADTLRSDKHLVKIDAQPLSAASRQYTVQIFDAESRSNVTRLTLVTKGDTPAETETTVSGTHYRIRIEPHGAAYLAAFTADNGAETIDTMRGGFLPPAKAPQSPAHAARAGRDIKEPKLLRRIDPLYTADAQAAHAAGTVVLEVLIDKSGFVREATVLKPMGYGLDESAIDAVNQWVFEPSLQERMPVEVSQEVTIEFKPPPSS